jgi:hypothetical protein
MNNEPQGQRYYYKGLNSQDIRQNIQYYIQYYLLISTVLFSIDTVICNNFTDSHYTDALFNCLTITYNAVV